MKVTLWRAARQQEGCPICRSREVVAYAGRERAVCRGCGALERQRALVHTVGDRLASGRGKRCLEAGPLNRRVFGEFLTRAGWEYVSLDQSRTGNAHDPRAVGFIDHTCTLTDLAPLASDSFDLFIAQHVIEEIVDYRAALREIARVLRPGAVALIEIPFDPAQPESVQHEPDHYGNVWRFGADLVATVESVIGATQVVELHEASYRGRVFVVDVQPGA